MDLLEAILRGRDSCDWKGRLVVLWQNYHHHCDRKKMALLEEQSLCLHAVQSVGFLYGVGEIALAHD
jgi:hypothetical protein